MQNELGCCQGCCVRAWRVPRMIGAGPRGFLSRRRAALGQSPITLTVVYVKRSFRIVPRVSQLGGVRPFSDLNAMARVRK
jgi:hypothetical protein